MKARAYSFDDACQFIIKLGTAAHGYGSNATRLEWFLARLTTALGFQGIFRSTPNEIIFAFQAEADQPQRIHAAVHPDVRRGPHHCRRLTGGKLHYYAKSHPVICI